MQTDNNNNKTTADEAKQTTAPEKPQGSGAAETAKLETGKYGAMISPSKETADWTSKNKQMIDRFGMGKLPKQYVTLTDKRFTLRERLDAV
jgi:hypothetical protein